MVSADTTRTVFGILGNAISLGLFLSPGPTFYRIWKKKSVEQFSSMTYLATLLNCMLWVVYGLPVVHPHSTLVITINGAGTAIELFYIALFLTFSDKRKRLRTALMLLVELVFVGVVAALVVSFAHTYERRSLVVGLLCVVFGTMMYAAPLSVMKLVMQTKSVEFMPLSISLASLANGVCWTVYALLHFDLFILIPNSIGVFLAAVQLILYAFYYRSNRRQIEARKEEARTTRAEMEIVVQKTQYAN